MKAKKIEHFSLGWPSELHERAKRIAEANRRSLNAQVLYWLENGGIPAELLDEAKADVAEAMEAGK